MNRYEQIKNMTMDEMVKVFYLMFRSDPCAYCPRKSMERCSGECLVGVREYLEEEVDK